MRWRGGWRAAARRRGWLQAGRQAILASSASSRAIGAGRPQCERPRQIATSSALRLANGTRSRAKPSPNAERSGGGGCTSQTMPLFTKQPLFRKKNASRERDKPS